jgi:hypothetical protein
MKEGLFGEPAILAVAIFVGLWVVALLMSLWFFFFKAWKWRFLPAVSASVFAIAAVIYGDLAFTRWALYTGGHGPPGLGEWLGFAAINAVLAVAAAIPGSLLGLVTAWLFGRTTPPQRMGTPGTEAEQTQKTPE